MLGLIIMGHQHTQQILKEGVHIAQEQHTIISLNHNIHITHLTAYQNKTKCDVHEARIKKINKDCLVP